MVDIIAKSYNLLNKIVTGVGEILVINPYSCVFTHLTSCVVNMATHRTNVIPIVEDARLFLAKPLFSEITNVFHRHPNRYRILVPMVDCIFADVAQPVSKPQVISSCCRFMIMVKS